MTKRHTLMLSAATVATLLVATYLLIVHNHAYAPFAPKGAESNKKVFISTQQINEVRTGVPIGKKKNITKGLSLYWIKESVVDGNDSCTLYDDATLQEYASEFTTSGMIGHTESGSTYYQNGKISHYDAMKLLSDYCYKQ